MTATSTHRAPRVLFVVLVILFFLVCGVHLTGMHHDGDLHGLALAVYSSLLVLILVGALALLGDERKAKLQAVSLDNGRSLR